MNSTEFGLQFEPKSKSFKVSGLDRRLFPPKKNLNPVPVLRPMKP